MDKMCLVCVFNYAITTTDASTPFSSADNCVDIGLAMQDYNTHTTKARFLSTESDKWFEQSREKSEWSAEE